MSLLNKIKTEKLVCGTCITSHNPLWPGAMESAGLDFVFIDTEHIPISRNELAHICQTFRGRGVTPLVRVNKPDHYLVCQAIDAGAVGVVAPYLESVDEIKTLVGATKLRPLKGKRLSGILSKEEPLTQELRAYLAQYNQGNICIANIESIPALENLDHLLDVEGLDAVFIGPHDLSVSMNLPERYDHPDFQAAVRKIINACKVRGLGIGIHFSEGPERQIEWIKEGINIIIHSSDVAIFSQKLRQDLQAIKASAGLAQGSDNTSSDPSI